MPMDPDAQRVVRMIGLAGQPLTAMAPGAARIQYRNQRRVMQKPPQDVAAVCDLDADGVALRLYQGIGAADGPGLLYCHGGGWVVGDLDSHDGLCRQLANLAQCRVIAVDYRLAPEHPFPAAVDDAATALRWVVRNAAALKINPDRIAVGGDSAGGNLAAVLALMGRDGACPAPCFQMLIYPATELARETGGYDRHGDEVTLTANAMRWYRDQYLGTAMDNAQDWRASPARASLAGTAAAFILTVGYDPLCDEGVAYAAQLDAAGVQTAHLHLPTQVHGFLTMDRIIRGADAAMEIAASMLRQAWRQRYNLIPVLIPAKE